MAHGLGAIGAALYLILYLRMLVPHLVEPCGVDGIGQGTARVEENLILNFGKGTYFYIRYVLAQSIAECLAWSVGIMVATICEGELVLTDVDAGCDAFVEQGETDDTVFTSAYHLAAHALYLIAAEGKGTKSEGGQLDGLHLTDMACGILRLDGAKGPDTRQLYIVVEDALTGTRVELETERTVVEVERYEDLVALYFYGHCHKEIALRHEEIRVVAFNLSVSVGCPHNEQNQ